MTTSVVPPPLTIRFTLALLTLLVLCLPRPARTQTPPPAADSASPRLRVYLECDCFQTYLREELTWVDFVRQPQDADVHVLSTGNETGGGGRELLLRFVGNGRFAGANTEARVLSQAAEPENLRRATVLRTMGAALLSFVARDGLPADFDVSIRTAARRQAADPGGDPWNLWVFRVSAGASLEAEESNRESQWNADATADRVTDRWKISVGAQLDEERETFNLDEEDDEPLEVTRRERSFEYFVARSLGPHWSLGLDGELESSTFGNTRFSAAAGPAVEFSVFPYREYATRQFVVQYQVGIAHARYRELTLFGLLEETRGVHELSTRLDQRQPWGSLEAGLEWSQYLHDAGKYRLEVDGEVSLRIVRGLAVTVEGSASRIRDQLSLPRRDVTPEEVLLQLRELQSGYDVSVTLGVSYSFGSLLNNVVNPRFGS